MNNVLDSPTVDPAKGDGGVGLDGGGHFVGEAEVAFGLAADVVLRLGGFAGDGTVGDVPGFDKMLDDGGVVVDGVDAGALGDDGEMVEEVRVFAVVHEAAGHGDDVAEHVAEAEHGTVGVEVEDSAHAAGIEGFVAGFVAGDALANSGEVGVALLGDEFAGVAVGDAGGAFLKGGVDEAVVGVGKGIGVEAVCDEVMDGEFDGVHIDAASEAEIGVEEVAVAVFLGGPAAEPEGPGGGDVAEFVACDIVEGDGVAGEGLFGDHVADEDDEHIVGDILGGGAVLLEGVAPVFLGEVGEEVGGLPGLVDGGEKGQVFLDEILHAVEDG